MVKNYPVKLFGNRHGDGGDMIFLVVEEQDSTFHMTRYANTQNFQM